MWCRLPVRYHGRVQYAPGNRYQSQAKARFLPRGQESHLCVMTGQHVRPERAGAAAGILTTTQQFGAASGIAILGAIPGCGGPANARASARTPTMASWSSR